MPERVKQTKGKKVNPAAGDDVLAVLHDERSGKEYYVSVIDCFEFKHREYTVMYNYRPEDGKTREPEIVVMRSYRGKDGEKYFTSIRGKRELEIVFEVFYQRYHQARQS